MESSLKWFQRFHIVSVKNKRCRLYCLASDKTHIADIYEIIFCAINNPVVGWKIFCIINNSRVWWIIQTMMQSRPESLSTASFASLCRELEYTVIFFLRKDVLFIWYLRYHYLPKFYIFTVLTFLSSSKYFCSFVSLCRELDDATISLLLWCNVATTSTLPPLFLLRKLSFVNIFIGFSVRSYCHKVYLAET